MRLARANVTAAHRRSRLERRAVSRPLEPKTGSPDYGPRLFRASVHDGQADWVGSGTWSIRRKERDARNENRDDTAAESDAAGTTSIESDLDRAGVDPTQYARGGGG
jgi:hypothetical protein